MYTGQRPWSGMNTGQIVYHVGMKAAQLPFPPASPPQLVALSRACTHPDPRQRCSFTRVNVRMSLITMATATRPSHGNYTWEFAWQCHADLYCF